MCRGLKSEKARRNKNTEQKTENNVVCVATSINTCIACGREIPEGMLVCMDCEVDRSEKRCRICGRLIAESEDICSNCRAVIFRSKK